MEIAIGIQFSTRELRIDVDEDAEAVRKQIEKAYASEQRLLWIVDTRGRQIAVPLDKLAYVEVDTEKADRSVGFASRAES